MVLTEEERKERRRESKRKYFQSEKGKAAQHKYAKSEKNKIAQKRYTETENGRQNINRRAREYSKTPKGIATRQKHRSTEKYKVYRQLYNTQENVKMAKNKSARKYLKIHWYKTIVKNSKTHDIEKRRLWNEEDYITIDFVKFLCQHQEGKCIYCQVEMIYGEEELRTVSDGLTIQRMDNALAHIRSNCVLCCFKCNMVAVSKTHQQMLDFLNS